MEDKTPVYCLRKEEEVFLQPLVLLSYSSRSWLTSLTQLQVLWRVACLHTSQGPPPLNLEALPQTPKMPLVMTAINPEHLGQRPTLCN